MKRSSKAHSKGCFAKNFYDLRSKSSSPRRMPPNTGHSSYQSSGNINVSEIIYCARVLEVTSCPAVPAACCLVYHKYFTKLNLGLRGHCVVEGSTPSRVNGSSVGRVHNEMEKTCQVCGSNPRKKNAYVLLSAHSASRAFIGVKRRIQSELVTVRFACKSVWCLKVWDTAGWKEGTTGCGSLLTRACAKCRACIGNKRVFLPFLPTVC